MRTELKPLIVALPLLLAALIAAPDSLAQTTNDWNTVRVADQVQVVQIGARSTNVGIVEGNRFVLLVDSYLPDSAPALLSAVKNAAGRTPDFLINTHFHGDHVGANSLMAEHGAVIVNHWMTRQRMSAPSWSMIREQTMPASPERALATIAMDDAGTLHLGEIEVHVIHLPSAHTDGDLAIFLPDANVLFAGDVLANGYPSLIDVINGGSLAGLLAAQRQLVELTDPATVVVPGHGPLTNREKLLESIRFLEAAQQELEQLVADLTCTDLDAGPVLERLPQIGQRDDPLRGEIFIENACRSLPAADD